MPSDEQIKEKRPQVWGNVAPQNPGRFIGDFTHALQ